MQEIVIKAETSAVADAFKNFVVNYKTNIADYMNQLIQNDGTPIDSEVVEENGELVVYHIAPDKGFVLGEVDGEFPFQVMNYNDLADDKRYLLQERGNLSLFLKLPTGEADIRLGAFKSIKDAASAWNSEPVMNKIVEAHDWKKARLKDLKRAARLDKSSIEEAQVVENNVNLRPEING